MQQTSRKGNTELGIIGGGDPLRIVQVIEFHPATKLYMNKAESV